MQKTINNIHKLTVYQHKSGIIFRSPDDTFFLDINSKNLESNFLDSIAKFNIETIELIFFSSIPSIVPSKLFDEELRNKYLIFFFEYLKKKIFLYYTNKAHIC